MKFTAEMVLSMCENFYLKVWWFNVSNVVEMDDGVLLCIILEWDIQCICVYITTIAIAIGV